MVPRTKKAIVHAFNRLISRYEFDNITVAMIAAEAEISKATFYRYFKDKYDVMNHNYKNLIDHYMQSGQCHNFRDLFYYLFEKGGYNWRFMKNAFRSTGINSMNSFIYEYSYLICQQVTRHQRGNDLTAIEEFQADLFCHGVSHLYQDWILGNYKISSDDAADALYAMVPESLRFPWQ